MPYNQLTTYSALDLNFALNSQVGISISAAGIQEQGWNKMMVRMTVDQSSIKVGADGAVVISAIPGDNGEIEIEVWQTSTLHAQLLAWYNLLRTLRDQADVSNWATSTIYIQNIVDGSSHQAVGVCPTKVPDKAYEAEAQTVNWVLKCGQIINQGATQGTVSAVLAALA